MRDSRSRWPRRVTRHSLIAGLLFLIGASDPAPGCGPSIPRPAYWFSFSPDEPDRFLAGELGVLTADLRAPFLLIAYRHLVGRGLDDSSQAAFAELWRVPRAGHWQYEAVQEWRDAVWEASGKKRYPDRVQVQKAQERSEQQWVGYFINCLEDAFRTATRTLRERVKTSTRDELAAWIEAQETVFGNCGGDTVSIPEPLDAAADPLAKADRAYQIAAAHFYAGNYDRAGALFSQIAVNPGSPWRHLAAYLEARSFIRAGSVGSAPRELQLEKAREILGTILADPERQPVHAMSQRLRQYIDLRLDPEGTLRDLRERLLAPSLPPSMRQDLIDYFWLLGKVASDEIEKQVDVDRWILSLRRHHDSRAAERTAEIWQRTAEDPEAPAVASQMGDLASQRWLAASLMLVEKRDVPWLESALEAAAAVEAGSPLYATIRYHLARLQRKGSEYEAARRTLSEALDEVGDRLSAGDRNRFELLLAEVAPTLAERIERGRRVPISYTWDYDVAADVPLGAGPEYLGGFSGHRWPADVAVNALNLASTERLVELLASEALEPRLARRLAPVVWTRAVLLGDEEAALAVESLAAAAAPEIADELAAYRQSAPGEERLFAAALAILRLPGLRPTLRHGFGRYGVQSFWESRETDIAGLDEFSYLRDNWWCVDPLHGIDWRTLAPLDEESREEAQGTLAGLRGLPPAPTHLGHVVLAWAETHPDDRRVPEALHRVVRGSRVCGGGDISRVSFQTLHRRYPTSPWAKKTKYWYQ